MKFKAIYERDGTNFVQYDNPDQANVIYENFYLVKKLFGVPIYRKRWRQTSNIWEKRAARMTGFK